MFETGRKLNWLVEELDNFPRVTYLPVCIFVSWKGNEQKNPGLFSQQNVHNLIPRGQVPSEAAGCWRPQIFSKPQCLNINVCGDSEVTCVKCKAYNSSLQEIFIFSFLISRMFLCVLLIILSRFNLAYSTCSHSTICLELVFRYFLGEEFFLPDGLLDAARGSQLK